MAAINVKVNMVPAESMNNIELKNNAQAKLMILEERKESDNSLVASYIGAQVNGGDIYIVCDSTDAPVKFLFKKPTANTIVESNIVEYVFGA